MLEIDALLDRRPGQLSGGQRQRVAIGRAIVRNPVAFLLDEPLSNLDAELRVSMRAELAALHARLATTMVYVTHDQVEAMTLADRIVVLRAGRIEQVDTPLALFNRPANRFVAGFIGAPAMNFLPAGAPRRPAGAATVGIRPQHLRLADPAPPAPSPPRSASSRPSAPRPSCTPPPPPASASSPSSPARPPRARRRRRPRRATPAHLHRFDATAAAIEPPGWAASTCRDPRNERLRQAEGHRLRSPA